MSKRKDKLNSKSNNKPFKNLPPWKIRIDDGFSAYEYTLHAKNDDVSIRDIYELARRKLRATLCSGEPLK
jgi:hypothetical protein